MKSVRSKGVTMRFNSFMFELSITSLKFYFDFILPCREFRSTSSTFFKYTPSMVAVPYSGGLFSSDLPWLG